MKQTGEGAGSAHAPVRQPGFLRYTANTNAQDMPHSAPHTHVRHLHPAAALAPVPGNGAGREQADAAAANSAGFGAVS